MITEVAERPINHHHTKVLDYNSKDQIVSEIIKGRPQTEIANKFGVTQGRINHIKKENQAFIDLEQQELVKLLPKARDIVTDDIEANSLLTKRIKIDPYNVDPSKIALKSELNKSVRDIWKIAGIIKPQALINFSQDNRTQTVTISDNVLSLFAPHAKELIQPTDTEVVEAEGVSDSDDNGDNVDNS